MPDRENVIRHFQDAISASGDGNHWRFVRADIIEDAIALLREQEKPDCEHAEHDGIGCLGYAGCTQDDEPVGVCKTCRKYTGNRYEEVSGDG